MSPERAEYRTRKRKRTIKVASALNPQPQPQPPAKRQKPSRRSRSRTPPEFWDNLSCVPICRRALREFNRRTVRPIAPKPPQRLVLKANLVKQLKQFARRGGPDLQNIRGYPESGTEAVHKMPSKKSNASGSRSNRTGSKKGTRTDPSSADPSSVLNPSTRPTIYSSKDPAFRQALIDAGKYPYNRGPKPGLGNLHAQIAQSRPSLSPSQFSEGAFEDFQLRNDEATGETEVMSRVFPTILGRNTIPSGYNQKFNHLQPLASNISGPQPDYYNGAQPSEVYSKVRDDLGGHITPCNDTSRPVLPNFFMEAKGPDGKASEMKLQITQDLAAGARGMHKMQSYGQGQPIYDGNAYTIGSTYHNGQLQLYAMHPTPPADPSGQPEYHTTQVGAYALTHNPDTCRQGIAAFRNAQDWAKEQRDSFITYANGVATGQLQQELELNDDDTDDDDEDELEADTSNTTHTFAHSFDQTLSTLNEDVDEDEDQDKSETSVEEEYRPPPQKRSKPQPARRKKSKKQSS